MPKETVKLESNFVSVGWLRGCDKAQIGVGAIQDDGFGSPSLWVDFTSRSEINALIRNLRKARDDAFGRDE